MNRKVEYLVRFPGSRERKDTFEFRLGDTFFAVYTDAGWEGGDISVFVSMDQKPDMITLDFNINGSVKVMCDRCLETYSQEVLIHETMIIKYGDEEGEVGDNILIIGRDQHQLDVSHYLYEFIMVAMPLKKVHPANSQGVPGCNRLMMEKLRQYIVSENDSITDPRWDALKKLQDKK